MSPARPGPADRLEVGALGGLAETFVPVLRHLAGRLTRRLRGRRAPLATRPEQVPPRSSGVLRPHGRRLARYLELTDGADLLATARGSLPPLFPVAWGLRSYLELLGDPGLDLSMVGVVHAQNDLIAHGPLRADDPLIVRLAVERLHRDERRAVLTIRADFDVGARTAAEMRTVLVAGVAPAEAEPRDEEPDPPGARWSTIRRVALGPGHALRYALLSGDVNPLHLLPLTSRPFGFPRPILHGFCLKSIVVHALARAGGGGDWAWVRRIRLRFTHAVVLPATLEVQTLGPRFRVVSADGARVHARGRFRLGPPEAP